MATGDGDRQASDGASPEFDEARLYYVIRRAVKDALLDVVGTLLLVGVALVLVWIGFATALSTPTPVGIVLGGLVAIFGVYLAASSLEYVPPIAEWF